VLAWAGALALGAATPASADAAPSTLRAVGNGLTFVTPDAATVNISVARAGASANAARGRENAQLQAILAGLQATGLPSADVQTANISLSREGLGPARRGHRRRFRFVASASLTVNTKRVDLLSRIFAAASHAGADSFNGPKERSQLHGLRSVGREARSRGGGRARRSPPGRQRGGGRGGTGDRGAVHRPGPEHAELDVARGRGALDRGDGAQARRRPRADPHARQPGQAGGRRHGGRRLPRRALAPLRGGAEGHSRA